MPHQRLVVDVATEVDADGRPYYGEIVVALPRQGGKTTLALSLELHRALVWGGQQRIVYTAQTGMDARQKLMEDQLPLIEASPIAAAVRQVYRANGSERIIFRNGSKIEPLPTTPKAGHGRTLDFGVIDEARFDVDDNREAALAPAMATKPEAQLLVISNAGDQTSVYFRRKVEAGRAAVERGDTSGTAFFEWSVGDEDVDIDDPAVWYRTHPALGLTIDERHVRQRRAAMPEGDFRREYLCQWTTVDESILPAHLVARVLDEATAPTGLLTFGIDVAMDRSYAAIAVADEAGNVELIEHREGVSWVVDRALQLWRQHRGALVVDGYSPANSVVDRLESGGIPVTRYTVRDMTAACGVFYDDILDQNIRLRPHASLEAAIASVRRKHVGSGWLWSRTTDAADLSPIFAATLAHYHATNRKEPAKQRSRIF